MGTENEQAVVDFKPSDVRVFGNYPPFVATFNKTEREVGAAYLVIALAARDDEWKPIAWTDVAAVLRAAIERHKAAEEAAPADETEEAKTARWGSHDNMIHSLVTNPIILPDFQGLVKDGFARWLGEPGKSELELTPAGIERLRKWALPFSSRSLPESVKTE